MKFPAGEDFLSDSQMLSSNTAVKTTEFPVQYLPSVFPVQYLPDGCCVCRNPHLAISPPAEEIDRKGGAPQISTQILQPRFLMLIPALGFLMKSRGDTDRPIEMGRSL